MYHTKTLENQPLYDTKSYMITPDLCRGARGILNVSSQEWAKRCGMARLTLHRYENNGYGSEDVVRALTETFADHGITFSRRGTVEMIKREG